jgi:Family of unknown function (DUF5343)
MQHRWQVSAGSADTTLRIIRMAVPDSYMNSVGNVTAIFEAVRTAGVPDRFNREFLKQLGFTSSNDRSVIPVMKALRFLDDNTAPTDRYQRYRDRTISGQVMAEALRDAYADLFKIRESAQDMSNTDLAGAFSRISGKGDAVARKMATTFKTLAGMADFSTPVAGDVPTSGSAGETDGAGGGEVDHATTDDENRINSDAGRADAGHPRMPALHHDIHVHLPVSTDVKVYDAIFRSLRSHLT